MNRTMKELFPPTHSWYNKHKIYQIFYISIKFPKMWPYQNETAIYQCVKNILYLLCNKSKLALNSLGSRVDWNSFVLLFVLLFSLESDNIICWDFPLKSMHHCLRADWKKVTNTKECEINQVILKSHKITWFIFLLNDILTNNY